MSDESVCSVCSRLTGFGDEDKGEPPVNLARCPSPGGLECRAVAQAVAPFRRENEVLRSNSDHLSSENASLVSQVESMAMRIESLAEELAKPEDVRLREVLDALDGRAVIFDGPSERVGHLLDEMDEWIERAGAAERMVEAARRSLSSVAEAMTEHAYQELASALESPPRIAVVVPVEVHEHGWQWRPTATDTAFAPPFGTIRQCRVCGCLVAGGPTACARCAESGV